jgi:two-component system sensor kinase FixL
MLSPALFEKEHALSILQSVVETAIDCIILIDTKGIILMINSAGLRLFGYSIEEVVGQNVSMLMPNPHHDEHDQYLSNYLQTGKRKIIGIGREVEGLTKDGKVFPIRLAVSEIKSDRYHYFTGIIQDLTEVKAVERQIISLNHELEQLVVERTTELQKTVNLLETNRQLNESIDKHKMYEKALVETGEELKRSLEKEKELNALKSRFISMASHEFKTPLSSILSSAALISRYTEPGHVNDRQRHVDRIKSSVHHLNNILTDFLSITRMEEGRMEPTITRFALEAVLVDLQSEAEGLLKPGQRLEWQIDCREVEVACDKNMLRNMVYNLLSNAIKYSDEGRTITCQAICSEDQLQILVRDEGAGIPVEDQKHIGTRFFRASNVENIPGTGLGLHIVSSYLQALQGKMTFTSVPGEGTTFIISLPIMYEAQDSDH